MRAYILVTAAESGDIKMWSIRDETLSSTIDSPLGGVLEEPTLLNVVDQVYGHGLAVKRLRWAPVKLQQGEGERVLSPGETLQFATCGEDRCVRIFSTHLN